MKLIILAAGKGSRLGELTKNTPKPLMDLGNGKTLLETQLDNILSSNSIEEVILVVGYCAEQIEAKIKKYQKEGMLIRTIYNPFYEVSNNLMSLWMAKHEMDEDFIVTNGDNIFEPIVFKDLVEKNKNGIFLTISKKSGYDEDDMKVIIDNGIERVSKQIKSEEANAESVGLTLISGQKYREVFKNSLEELARDQDYINKFWLEIFNRLADKGVSIKPFEINGKELWTEIDFHGDINNLVKDLMAKKASMIGK